MRFRDPGCDRHGKAHFLYDCHRYADSSEGSGSSFVARRGGSTLYTGDYITAIQRAVDSISSGQRVSVLASGSIGASTITIQAGKTFEGCGTINAAVRSGRGAIEVTDAANVKIPYLTMTGNV
jgi:hypothetical protein